MAESSEYVNKSPINIITDQTQPTNSAVRPLTIAYNSTSSYSQNLKNTGRTWNANIVGDNFHINGGPMNPQHQYRLAQIHCHWGMTTDIGSEHTINGLSYSGELHFVHWNTNLSHSFEHALTCTDIESLAVIGVFLKIGQTHTELEKITSFLQCIRHKDDCITMPVLCDPAKLFPECLSSYWSYTGSLTWHSCNEIVQWIMLKEPIECSMRQLEEMRSLNGKSLEDQQNELIRSNFCLTFDVGERIVYNYV